MTNPVEAERRFLELQRRLNHNLSYRQQWLEIGDFLKLIEGHFATYDTHCEQLAEQMPVFTHPLSVTGTDPSQFEDILALLSALSESVPSLQHSRNFSEAKEALLVATVFLYLCLHQFESANRLFFGEQPDAIQKAVDIKGYLDKALAYVQSGATNLASGRIDRLNKWWGLVNEKSPNTLYVPVVEVSGPSEKQGRLRKLTATVLNDNEVKDIFRNSYSVVGAESEDAGIRREVIEATRKLLEQSHPDLKQKFFDLQFEYGIPLGLHMGRSSDLACCLSAYSAILNAVNSRERFEPGDRMAVTGRLEKASRIEAVEAEGIVAKTRAVFFSWMEYLVVPEKQKHRFMEQLAILKEKYPAKLLKLIGLEEPEAFFYDRRISEHHVDSMPKYIAQKAWQKKFSVAGVSIILLLLIVIARLWYGPIDQNPVTGTFEGRMLKLHNAQGALVTSFEVGIERNTYQVYNGTDGSRPQVQLYDINQDGINEVFWYEISGQMGVEHNRLKSWSITGDSLIWEMPLRFDIRFPKKNSIVDTEYYLDEFHIQKSRNGTPLIIGSTNLDAFFPSVIFTANARIGNIEQQYIHTGHFNDIVVLDINKDGILEVIGLGANNAYWNAAIVVLNMENLHGHGPLQGGYIVEDFSPAEEISYILVPKTIVGKYYDPIQKMNYGINIRIMEGEDLLYIRIRDAEPVDFQGAGPAYIILYLNKYLQVEGIGTSDAYDVLARRLHREGKIPFEPDYEYFEAFKDSLVYLSRSKPIIK